MKIYFTRHGESQANVLREFSCRGLKHPLTPAGRRQAAALAQKLQGRAISRIFSSPVLRAIETSITLAHRLGVDYTVVEALREFDVGILEGRTDEPSWQMLRNLYDDWIIRKLWDRRMEGGENFYDVQKRFVPFIQSLTGQYAGTDENLLCVAHGGIYWAMLPLVLQGVDDAFIEAHGGIDYTAWIETELRPEGLVCLEWNGKAAA